MSAPPRPELLVPAGDRETLRAAAANGADAVYFGLRELNARLRAPNFGIDELPEVLHFLHDRNVRGYVTLNTLVLPGALPRAAELLAAIARAGADAVIVQDLGLARLARRLAPSLPVHASTQMTLTEPRGIALARKLGLRRALLARELSIAEIARVAEATDLALEVFVHGALCVSFSGQCLASLALGGRSGNRGVCAQACRLPYRLVVDGGAPRSASGGPHILSPRDLAAHDRLADLLRAGVMGFKIEGRLKGPAYVAAATRAYREALDAAIDGRPFALPPERIAELLQSFSRGFTRGFLDGTDHRELVDPRTPKHRGVLVGTVVGTVEKGLLVESCTGEPLKPGDGVFIECGGPDSATQGGRVYEVLPFGSPLPSGMLRGSPLRGRRPKPVGRQPGAIGPGGASHTPSLQFAVRFGHGDIDLGAVPTGARVWKTDDPAMRRRLEGSFARDAVARRAPVTARVSARLGEPLRVTLADAAGRESEAAWDRPLARAEKHPLTLDLLRDQLGRLGDTPFELARVTADPLDPVMVPKSVLNDLRRRAAEGLLALRQAAEARAVVEPEALEALRAEARGRKAPHPVPDAPALHVLVRAPAQLEAALAWTPADPIRRPVTVWCDLADPAAARDAVARIRESGLCAGLATLRILKLGEEGLLRAVLEAEPDAVLVRTLGALAFFREAARDLPLVADASLNAVNELSVDPLLGWGAARVTPGMDLDGDPLKELASRIDPALLEIVAHRHAPMFHTAHCLVSANLGGGRDCAHCDRPCDRHRLELEDRKGARHPVVVDAAGRNTVFHGTAVSCVEDLPGLLKAGVRHVRVELLHESASETRSILDVYGALLAGRIGGTEAWRRLRELAPAGLLRAMRPAATTDKVPAGSDE